MQLASRKLLVLPVVWALASPAGAAWAQAAKSNDATGSSSSAVDTDNAAGRDKLVTASALERGSNSFTEGQARSRFESAGLSDVTDLKKDDAGIWRGKARRDGESVSVGLDYKGKFGDVPERSAHRLPRPWPPAKRGLSA